MNDSPTRRDPRVGAFLRGFSPDQADDITLDACAENPELDPSVAADHAAGAAVRLELDELRDRIQKLERSGD